MRFRGEANVKAKNKGQVKNKGKYQSNAKNKGKAKTMAMSRHEVETDFCTTGTTLTMNVMLLSAG